MMLFFFLFSRWLLVTSLVSAPAVNFLPPNFTLQVQIIVNMLFMLLLLLLFLFFYLLLLLLLLLLFFFFYYYYFFYI